MLHSSLQLLPTMKKQGFKTSIQLTSCLENLLRKETTRGRQFVTSTTKFNQAVTWESAKPFNEIPSALMLPFIGTAWQTMPIIGSYKADRLHLANRDRKKRLGGILREKFGSFNLVMSFSVEDLEKMYKAEGEYPSRSELHTIQAYRAMRKEWFSTGGLLVLQGKEWQELRQKTQKHLLKPLAILDYLEPMHNVARDFAQRIRENRDVNKEVPEFDKELYKWSLESVSLVGLDTRLGCLDRNLSPDSDGLKMIKSVTTQFECMNKLEPFSGNLLLWKWFSTPTWRKFVKASDVYSEIAFKYINKAVDDLKLIEKRPNKKLTLLQNMFAKKDLSVSDAMVFVADMLMAGIETTSHTIGFLLYHLARNPEKQEALHQEITRLLPTNDSEITPEIYESLKLTKASLKETLRLSPVVGGSARVLARDTVMSGYQVPAGTFTVVVYDDMYADEKYYKNATQFIPERWLNKNERPHPFAFLPFGFGPRSCIGRRLAELEMVCAITQIVRNFKIEYHFEDFGFYTRMIIVPDKPLRFNFIER